MKSINGMTLSELPIHGLEKICDLDYLDGPLMSVFQSSSKEFFIYDWVDKDNEANRWMVYQTTTNETRDYLNKKISHFELMNGCQNNLIFFVDLNYEAVCKHVVLTSISEVPDDYFPAHDIFFDADNSVNLERLQDLLTDNRNPSTLVFKGTPRWTVLGESAKAASEILNIHFNGTQGVGYGKIDSNILGKILVDINELYGNLAVDVFKDRKVKIYSFEKKAYKTANIEEKKELAHHDFLYRKAASFSLFLRPSNVNFQRTLFQRQSPTAELYSRFVDLLKAGDDMSALVKAKKEYSDAVLESLKKLLSDISEMSLNVGFNWADFSENKELKNNVDSHYASKAVGNLTQLEYTVSGEITLIGKFKALDEISKTFKFASFDTRTVAGKFHSDFHSRVFEFNLRDQYSIKISKKEMKKAGKNKLEVSNTLIFAKNLSENLLINSEEDE